MNTNEELLSQHKDINNLNEEQLEKHYGINTFPDDLLTEENLIKIKSLIVCLDNYNKYQEIKNKNEIECFYSQINNFSMKERVVLDTMILLSKSHSNKNKKKFLKYNDIIDDDNNGQFNIDKKIFDAVARVAHKTLHKDKNEKSKNIICQMYNDLSDYEFKESGKSIGYNNVDKLINSLKEKQPYIEFIAIKAIIASMTNITQELIDNYYKISEEINLNVNVNIINDENDISDDDETETIEINPKIFEILFNDYIFISNRCSFLENFFIESFNNFRNKFQIKFTLSDLFNDIFWDKIFHNKILCKKFINIYIGNDKCEENIRKTLSKIIKIISDKTIPLKNQIKHCLSLRNYENSEIDLMSSIISQKNVNHDFLQSERIINTVNNKALNPEGVINDKDIKDINKDKNEIKIEEEKEDKKEELKNEIKEMKEKKEEKFNEGEMENKTVDEIYNYINDNNEIKTKKKKRNKKKKNKKNEKQIKIIYEEQKVKENEDDIVYNFKQDIIKNVIDANKINKIKPFFTDNYLNMISQKY